MASPRCYAGGQVAVPPTLSSASRAWNPPNLTLFKERWKEGRPMRRLVAWTLFACVVAVLCPSVASAQASISGLVQDATGAVLPGVTVEASSPALIEQSRTVITNDAGRYTIVDLRPGVYAIT